MRNAFMEHLTQRAAGDERVFLVVGDLGFSVIEPFVERFPDRFLNAGVAEQNMTAVACGLAREGYHVFTYSIANFTTLRCLEQIRNGICYHELPVCVVSVGGGFMYAALGPTHHATEDIGILRTLPGMRVFAPFSRAAACCALDEVLAAPGPAYIRLGRQEIDVPSVSGTGLTLVRACNEGQCANGAVIVAGQISPEVLEIAADRSADLYALCRINPLPAEDMGRFFETYQSVTVVEDHQRACGVFSALSEFRSDLESVSVAGAFASCLGREAEIRREMLFQRSGS